MKRQLNFAIKNQADETPEILVYDQIGHDWWTGEGVTAKRFREDLAALGKPAAVNVRINSEGGSVFEGFAIYNALREFAAKGSRVVVIVDAAAMSIASVIAMAGDEIQAQENATWMIHDAWTIAMGNAEELRKTADLVEQLSSQIADVYVARTGQTLDDVRGWMKAETWWTAREAMEHKFVDVVLDNKKAPQPVSDLTLRTVRNAPAWVKQRAAERTSLLKAQAFHRQALVQA